MSVVPTRLVTKIWLSLQEPRKITALQTMLYLLVAFAGVGVLLWTPTSIEGRIGMGLTIMWGWFALLGGVLGAWATPGGRWYLERAAIWLCGTAVLFYLLIVGYLQVTTSGNRLVQMAFIAIAGVALGIRFERIREFDFEPGK